MSKFGTKNALFGYFGYALFGAGNIKNYCHIWNQHVEISQKRVFNLYN